MDEDRDEDQARRWRAEAERCRDMADHSQELRSRAEFLNLAAAYDALADRLEKQREGARKAG